jgi:RNA polymerase sigma-70 factor (ECF subfamily)
VTDHGVVMSSSDSGTLPALPTEEFVQLFTKSQRRLFLHILSMIPNPIDAEEVLQETNIVIWNKFSSFQMGTNFLAWARRIATFEVLRFRERKARDRHHFSDDFMELVTEEFENDEAFAERRRTALMRCLDKLRPGDRELIRQRYSPGLTGRDLARELGRPSNSVYQSLGRIRRTLLECVKRQLAAEGF